MVEDPVVVVMGVGGVQTLKSDELYESVVC